MPPVGFEPTISAGELPKTYALDRAATGIGSFYWYILIIRLSEVKRINIWTEKPNWLYYEMRSKWEIS